MKKAEITKMAEDENGCVVVGAVALFDLGDKNKKSLEIN
jgi:hypothetical protein